MSCKLDGGQWVTEFMRIRWSLSLWWQGRFQWGLNSKQETPLRVVNFRFLPIRLFYGLSMPCHHHHHHHHPTQSQSVSQSVREIAFHSDTFVGFLPINTTAIPYSIHPLQTNSSGVTNRKAIYRNPYYSVLNKYFRLFMIIIIVILLQGFQIKVSTGVSMPIKHQRIWGWVDRKVVNFDTLSFYN